MVSSKRLASVALDNTADKEAASSKSARRAKTTVSTVSPFEVTNIKDGETVFQQCLMITGNCPSFENSDDNFVTVRAADELYSVSTFQNWPVGKGCWKALIVLGCGKNDVVVDLHHAGGIYDEVRFAVTYQPLLQLPPLHLAIMVAKDSPLQIDCPPSKYGAFPSTHNSLDAAVSKLRTTALMWQAFTAEDMRQKGLGRRCFRLEDDWALHDTFRRPSYAVPLGLNNMSSQPKVHIIHTEKTVAQLRDPTFAQNNDEADRKEELHMVFERALKAHGPPFDSVCRPIVAGLIFDSHYDIDSDLILAHAALGDHRSSGISLGMFGSHLTYSWPRSMAEVPDCLADARNAGDTVGGTHAEACFIGQGAFLHEVGHAFGAEHTTGIMARTYSRNWGHCFLAHKEDLSGQAVEWELQDALCFKTLPHFQLPGDDRLTGALLWPSPTLEIPADPDSGEDHIIARCDAGLAAVDITNEEALSKRIDLLGQKTTCKELRIDPTTYSRAHPLGISILALNGRTHIVKDAWRLFNARSYIMIPGHSTPLRKQSVISAAMPQPQDQDAAEELHEWTVMLKRRSENGSIVRASAIDLRVGATMDGAIVHYADGMQANCGPVRGFNGEPFCMGGGESEKHDLTPKDTIVKVELAQRSQTGWGSLDGVRMTLASGQTWGHLNIESGNSAENEEAQIYALEPRGDEKVVGFFGTSAKYGYCYEFGIITVPREWKLPEAVHDMKSLQNFEEQEQEEAESEDIGMSDTGSDCEGSSQETMP